MTTASEKYNLKRMPVLLSASLPDETADSQRVQDLYTVIALLTHAVVAAGGRIVFGGHPSIAPLVRETVNRLEKGGVVDLYQLRRFQEAAPEAIHDDGVFSEIHWIEADDDIDAELGRMRDRMAEAARAAIFAGGKTAGHYGKTPGIRDEYQRFTAKHPEGPVYLVGLLGGETLKLIEEMAAGKVKACNGLSEKEREVIHHSTSIDLVTSLILGDLTRKAEGNGKQA